MPSDDGLRLHQDQRLPPMQPKLSEQDPEEPVWLSQPGPRLLPFGDRQLLAKRGDLQREIVPRHKEGAEVGNNRADNRNHRSIIHIAAFGGPLSPSRNRLNLFPYGVLMTNRRKETLIFCGQQRVTFWLRNQW